MLLIVLKIKWWNW